MYSFIDFIRTGELGFLKLGIPRVYVESTLGPYSDISVLKNPCILKYGSLELTFKYNLACNQSELISIYMEFNDNRIVLPEKLEMAGWIPTNDTSESEFIRILEENCIVLKPDPLHTLEGSQRGYISSAGVVAVFGVDGEYIHLANMGIAKRRR